MPQMSPIMWTTMLIITTMLTYQMNSMNLFDTNKLKKMKHKKKKETSKKWKW